MFTCLFPVNVFLSCVDFYCLMHTFLFVPAHTKQVDPGIFRVFYTFWKEAEAEAQHVNWPSEVIDCLDNHECVYKLSSCVKTSCGVGKIAMTQKRLFMLTQGQPGFVEITKFREIQVNTFNPYDLLMTLHR